MSNVYKESGHYMTVEEYGDQWKCRIVCPSTKQQWGTAYRDTRGLAIADGLRKLTELGRKFRGEKVRVEREGKRLEDAFDHGMVAQVFAPDPELPKGFKRDHDAVLDRKQSR